MQWDDLKVFLAVARGESLSSAGRSLRIDPATVGRRVSRLETQLGNALFLRSAQGYALTEAGTRLMAHAERVETEIAASLAGLSGPGDRLRGQVRIGAPDGCATYLLPQVCTQIAHAHPELELQIVALPRVFNLSRREADLAIAVTPPTQGRVVVRKITEYHLHLAASQTYLETCTPITTREDLQNHPMVGYIPDMIFDSGLDYAQELGPDRPSLSSNSVIVQLQLLQRGAGIGMVHDFALSSAPGLTKILSHEISLKRAYYLLRPGDQAAVDSRLARVADLLSDGLRRETARLEAVA